MTTRIPQPQRSSTAYTLLTSMEMQRRTMIETANGLTVTAAATGGMVLSSSPADAGGGRTAAAGDRWTIRRERMSRWSCGEHQSVPANLREKLKIKQAMHADRAPQHHMIDADLVWTSGACH